MDQASTFWVELAVAEDPTGRSERAQARPDQAHEQQQDQVGPVLTVLYIEDNPANLKLVERVLSRRPAVKMISAMGPLLGLDLAREHHPDLILLDLSLPDMPGEEVLRRLRAGSKTADVPVVILSSADTSPELCTRLLERGVRTFLTKPLEVKELLGLLDTIAAERQPAESPPASS